MEANFITAVFLPLALAVIMLGMGMSLTVADFKRVVIYPKAVSIGLLNQLVLLPFIALGIASIFPLSPELAVGLMVLAVCPGGPTSNLISYLCRADVALSITLTAISSLVTVLTIPILINWSLGHFMGQNGPEQLSLLGSSLKIVILTLVPTAIGMILNRQFPAVCRRATRVVNGASLLLFLMVLAAAIYSQRNELLGFFQQAGWAVLALNVLTMAAGYCSAKAVGLRMRQGLTISIESGLQNGTLAIAITTSPLMLNSPPMAIVPAIYSLVMFATAGALIGLSKVRSVRATLEKEAAE